MFKKSESSYTEIETIIGPSVKVEGDFAGEGDVVVEGLVTGSLKTTNNLKVGEKAKIFANISANNALIAGEVQGNIMVKEKLELTSTAKINGDIKAKSLSVIEGALLNGKVIMASTKEEKKKFSELPPNQEKELLPKKE